MDKFVNPKEIKKFVCLLGCPRSGTTLATALIDAHPAVEMFYEPWNSSKKNPPPIYTTPLQFKRKMREKVASKPNPEAEIVGFKETSEHFEALEWSENTISSMSKSCECVILCLVRDPMHAYLSKIEGAKKYWENPDAKVTEEGYKNFINKAVKTYSFVNNLSNYYKTIIFDYESLVSEPKNILEKVMYYLDIDFNENQLNYYENGLQERKVMGDPRVAKQADKVSTESLSKRRIEAAKFQQNLSSGFLQMPQLLNMNRFLEKIKATKVTDDSSLLKVFN